MVEPWATAALGDVRMTTATAAAAATTAAARARAAVTHSVHAAVRSHCDRVHGVAGTRWQGSWWHGELLSSRRNRGGCV